jgi:hypothetical protein
MLFKGLLDCLSCSFNYLCNIYINSLTYIFLYRQMRLTTLIDRCSMTSIERHDMVQSIAKKNKRHKIITVCIFKRNECQKHCAVTYDRKRENSNDLIYKRQI